MLDTIITKDNSKMKNIILMFLILHPVLDLLTSLSVRFTELDVLSVGVVVRTAFMIGIGIYVIFEKGRDAKLVRIYYIVLGVYIILFLYNVVFRTESALLIREMKSLIKTLYFPIVLSGLWVFNKKERLIDHNNIFKLIIIQYLLIIFIATVTGTSFDSYTTGHGSVGWFYAANEKGAILSILLPAIFLPLVAGKWRPSNIIPYILLIFSIFYVGTKVPPLSFIIFYTGMFIVTLFGLWRRANKVLWRFSKVAAITLLLSAILSLQSPLIKNLVSSYGSFFDGATDILVGEQTDEEKQKEIDDKKLEQVILSSRNIYRDQVRESYENSDVIDKLMGIGYHIKDEKGETTDKLIEMDLYDIYYRHGIIGTLIYFTPLVYIAVILLRRFFMNFKDYMSSYEVISYCYSILIGLSIGAMSGHVLTSPAVSIYMAVSMIALYSSMSNKENRLNSVRTGEEQ